MNIFSLSNPSVRIRPWAPLSLVITIEELLGRKSIGPGLESREYGRRGSVVLTKQHPLSAKVGTDLADKRRSFGRYSSLADSGHRVWFSLLKGSYRVLTEVLPQCPVRDSNQDATKW
jgi:hypothetical protein